MSNCLHMKLQSSSFKSSYYDNQIYHIPSLINTHFFKSSSIYQDFISSSSWLMQYLHQIFMH